MLRKPKRKEMYALSFAVLALLIFGLPLMAVQAADGTDGNIQHSAQIMHVSGSAISVSMWDLDVSSDYQLNWTGNDGGINYTTSATQTTFTYTFVLTSSAATVTFFLRGESAGAIIDQTDVTVVNLADFLATGLIISAGIFILIIVIFKRIVK